MGGVPSKKVIREVPHSFSTLSRGACQLFFSIGLEGRTRTGPRRAHFFVKRKTRASPKRADFLPAENPEPKTSFSGGWTHDRPLTMKERGAIELEGHPPRRRVHKSPWVWYAGGVDNTSRGKEEKGITRTGLTAFSMTIARKVRTMGEAENMGPTRQFLRDKTIQGRCFANRGTGRQGRGFQKTIW